MEFGLDPCFFLIAVRSVGRDESGFSTVTVPWYLFFSAECNAKLKTTRSVLFHAPLFTDSHRATRFAFLKHLAIPGLEDASSPDRVRDLEEPSLGHRDLFIGNFSPSLDSRA